MRWFLKKSSVGAEPLAVTMSGVRLGERVLQIGLDDPRVAAAIAAKTGMTGVATHVVSDEARAGAVRSAVADAGGLGDVQVGPFDALPFAEESYDAVVLHAAGGLLASQAEDVRHRMLGECRRVLRSGGRVIVLEAGSPTGLLGLVRGGGQRNRAYETSGGTGGALESARFRAVRTLGDRQGYRFIEGLKSGA